jgi:hypothetical protein
MVQVWAWEERHHHWWLVSRLLGVAVPRQASENGMPEPSQECLQSTTVVAERVLPL